MITKNYFIVINAGSSSIKFALYKIENLLIEVIVGSVKDINTNACLFSYTNFISKEEVNHHLKLNQYKDVATYLYDWLRSLPYYSSVIAIGHRIVHGLQYTSAKIITPFLLNKLKKHIAFSPLHLPTQIMLIQLFAKQKTLIIQIACFDTAFHSSMPLVAKLLPIPKKYFSMGIQRYGYHGISYQYLLLQLVKLEGKKVAKGKIIMAHLGNGASITAVHNGKSVDTSMGFSPTSGLMMGTRTGDIDPSILTYLLQNKICTIEELSEIINNQSGLLGVAETTSNMQQIIKIKNKDSKAADAFNLFCYQTKKYIGAYAAVLNGLDTLIFTGGIGEQAAEVRSTICEGLNYIGVEIDVQKNKKNEAIISTKNSFVKIHIIPTNEQYMLASNMCALLKLSIKNI